MVKDVQLGSFILQDPIGAGGMGRVYHGVHNKTGVSVAVKLILDSSNHQSRRFFHREVQAHAGLTHPGVVYLFDYGTVDEEAAQMSDGEFLAGSPFVAMEFATQGTVRDLRISSWNEVRQILLQVLDALAFAHARGVIHRDLKPENLLCFPQTGSDEDRAGPGRIKLADFGLAHAFSEVAIRDEKSLARLSGTPYYMAPEQVQGHWQEYGPWTDIYALGCIAWELVCGEPPFTGGTPLAVAMKHLTDERPALRPRFAVPRELESWIHRAFAIRHQNRFLCAADAAWMLPEPITTSSSPKTLVDPPPVIAASGDTTLVVPELNGEEKTLILTELQAPLVELKESRKTAPAFHPSSAPPLPPSWHSKTLERLPEPMVGTGLGLFDLREIPFVDRNEERDLIWETLETVVDEGHFRIIFIIGEAGSGKSRLAQWTATRAHEVGATRVLKAFHSPGGHEGGAEGFSGMAQRYFQGWKLSRGQFYKHCCQFLPASDARALTEVVHPTEDDAQEVDGPRYQFISAAQRNALLLRMFRLFALQRTPLIWFDDLQWAPHAMQLLEYLLGNNLDLPPSLVLATVQSDIIKEDHDLARRLDALCEHEACQRIYLDPLEPGDHREFIDRILRLEPALRQTLAERTEGNPLFAHQLLGDWIAEGRLEMGEYGFQADSDLALSLPEKLHELWMTRIQRLAREYSPQIRPELMKTIEVASALGREIDEDEWHSLVASLEWSVPNQLAERLIERGLAERTEDGWAFSHGLLMESVKQNALEAGRWSEHHKRCALMLRQFYPEKLWQTARRRAEHWIAAGELEQALEPMLEEAARLKATGQEKRRFAYLLQRRELLDQMEVDPLDPRYLDNEILIAISAIKGANYSDTQKQLERLLAMISESDHPLLASKVCHGLGICLSYQGQMEKSERLLNKALDLACIAHDRSWQAKVLFSLAWNYTESNDRDRAEDKLIEARKIFRESDMLYDELWSTISLAWVYFHRKDYDRAHKIFTDVHERISLHGFRAQQSNITIGLGEIARYRGDVQTARRLYEEAHKLNVELDRHRGALAALMNLTLLDLETGNYTAAEVSLDQVETMFENNSQNRYRPLLTVSRLVLACTREDWNEFDRLLAHCREGWAPQQIANGDIPRLLKLAASLAEKAGQPLRARNLRSLAMEIYLALDDHENFRKLQAQLDRDSE